MPLSFIVKWFKYSLLAIKWDQTCTLQPVYIMIPMVSLLSGIMSGFISGISSSLYLRLLLSNPQDGNDNLKLYIYKVFSFVNYFGMVIHGSADLLLDLLWI